MLQLDIFTKHFAKDKVKLNPGRPSSITSEIVLLIIEDINKSKMSNIEIMQKHSIKQRTFYRIKKGEYNHLLKEALELSVDNFTLELSD